MYFNRACDAIKGTVYSSLPRKAKVKKLFIELGCDSSHSYTSKLKGNLNSQMDWNSAQKSLISPRASFPTKLTRRATLKSLAREDLEIASPAITPLITRTGSFRSTASLFQTKIGNSRYDTDPFSSHFYI